MKNILTYDEAISVLPNSDSIHTFYNEPFGLIGADWSREDILNKFKESNVVIELTGEQARNMKHGICVRPNRDYYQHEVLFVETDEEKLSAFEQAHPTEKGGVE